MIGLRRRGAQGICLCGFCGVALRSELVTLGSLNGVVVKLVVTVGSHQGARG
jgi:hypothetical protein